MEEREWESVVATTIGLDFLVACWKVLFPIAREVSELGSNSQSVSNRFRWRLVLLMDFLFGSILVGGIETLFIGDLSLIKSGLLGNWDR